MDKQNWVNPDDEKLRYEEHNNDVNNAGYQNFVSPITNAILNDFNKKHKGLDFGAGTGPVISKLLNDQDFTITQYDPFFHNYPHLLDYSYDYIACCEVIEHFNTPDKEFRLLKDLLLPKGKLYCMTDLYHENIDFKTWYYKDDQTHVFFYHKNSIEWIKENYNFSSVYIQDRLIVFQR